MGVNLKNIIYSKIDSICYKISLKKGIRVFLYNITNNLGDACQIVVVHL